MIKQGPDPRLTFKCYGFDRAGWRGLWRMQIQNYLICAIRNIQVLIRQAEKPCKPAAAKAWAPKRSFIQLRPPWGCQSRVLYLASLTYEA